ncbi:Gfo/Idh/MocA family protein [Aeoliella sp.]|uniref:Gfo/Idh/MocA family protein n=1 Tax=Aeoliella sp. TaxID=2795800 RepID=UPI003CCBD7AF
MNAAVIGTGGISRFHAANNLKPHFAIRAICDVDRESRDWYNKEFASGQAVVSTEYRELLERDDIDVVFVCTPDHWHAKIAIDAMRSGKDVYCEKPLTLTVAEGKLVREVARETRRVLQVGTQQRSDPNFQTAVALAHSGRLGSVKRITVAIGGGPAGGPFPVTAPPAHLDWDRWQGPAPETPYITQRCHGNFRWWYEYSGGKLTDWGAHHVDIANWAIDPDSSQNTIITPEVAHLPVPYAEGMPTVHDCYNTATSFKVLCLYSNGAELVIRDEATDLGFENGILVECEEGRYFVNRGKLTGKPVEELATNPLPDDLLAGLRRGRGVMPHMANFYWSCRERTEGISDATSHMAALNLCHLANVSVRLDRSIPWNPTTESTDEATEPWLSRKSREEYSIA